MSNKYEQLVEFIINDETDKARELFHTIVVEKSRDIYESLMDEEDLDEVGGNRVKGLVDEIALDEEGISEEEEFSDEEESEEEDGAFDHEEGHEGDSEEAELEDRVVDLESALDELKAEFDALMAGEEHEEEAHPGIHGDEGSEESDAEDMMYEAKEEDDEEDDEEDEEELDENIVREYVEKVADVNAKSESGKLAGADGSRPLQTKSTVAGKNDMGGKAVNITAGGTSDENGTTPNKSVKPKGELVGKVLNTPGSDAGKTAFRAKEKQQGGQEGKLAGADGSRPINKQAVIKTTPR
jgi:hypothetical protein